MTTLAIITGALCLTIGLFMALIKPERDTFEIDEARLVLNSEMQRHAVNDNNFEGMEA